MEIRYLTSSEIFPSSQSLRHSNSCNIKFLQQSYKKRQRLIPLTREIKKAMMDFNGSESGTSVSEREGLVRGAVNIDDIIEKLFVTKENKSQHLILDETNGEFQITVQEIEDSDENMVLAENVEMLERRITNLEKRLSALLQSIPKFNHIQAKKCIINSAKDMLNSFHKTNLLLNMEKKDDKSKDKEIIYNIYDQIFYTKREYTLNLLNYKKSLESLELNQKPKLNPYVKPIIKNLCTKDEKSKKLSMFLTS